MQRNERVVERHGKNTIHFNQKDDERYEGKSEEESEIWVKSEMERTGDMENAQEMDDEDRIVRGLDAVLVVFR